MANEIRFLSRLQFWRNSVLDINRGQKEVTVSTTSELIRDNAQVVGTSHEAVDAGDVTDDAFAMIENLHATATVTVGGDATGVFVPWFDIPPGYPPAVMPAVASLAATYLQSDTASTPVRVTLCKIVAPS